MAVIRIFSTCGISIHALLAESDPFATYAPTVVQHFYPRSPCGERRLLPHTHPPLSSISIHALLAESDSCRKSRKPRKRNFYPRSPCGERRWRQESNLFVLTFLSTLSLRRATLPAVIPQVALGAFLSTLSLRRATRSTARRPRRGSDFYPRSPCGERQDSAGCHIQGREISIHALLAESDFIVLQKCTYVNIFLSTLSLRRATL